MKMLKECWKEGLEDVGALQFSFMPHRGTTDAVSVVTRMQEKFGKRGVNVFCRY